MTRIIKLALLLALVLTSLLPMAVSASDVVESAVGGRNYQDDVGGRRCSFYDEANGREWVFFLVSGVINWRTNTGNATWTARQSTGMSVGGGYNASGFSVAWDGVNVHFGIAGGDTSVYYRMAQPAADGLSLTYSAALQTVASGGVGRYRVGIGVDSEGYPWVTFAYHNGSSVTPYAVRSSKKDGTWSTDITRQLTSLSWNWCQYPLSLGNRHMLFVLGVPGYPLYGAEYNGSGWESIQGTDSNLWGAIGTLYSSGVGGDGVAEVVFIESSAYNIKYVRWSDASNDWGVETTLGAGVSGGTMPIMSRIGVYALSVSWQSGNNTVSRLTASGGSSWWGEAVLSTDYNSAQKYYVGANYLSGEFPNHVFFADAYADLRTVLDWGNVSGGIPFGEATGAEDITAYTATLRGHLISAGGNTTTAWFYWGSPSQDGNETYGIVATGENFEAEVEGLLPSQTYGYWIVFTNVWGDYWTVPVVWFNTPASSEYAVPVVVTNPLNPALDVGDTSARLYGYLTYDGGLPCQAGFQYRVKGTVPWFTGWNGGTYHTAQQIRGTLTSLLPHTTYEYRAVAKNAMNIPTDYENGATLEFTTSVLPGMTPTATGMPGLPPVIADWLAGLSGGGKQLLAIIITIGGMVVIALQLKTAKAAGLVVFAYALFATILFLILGWYPTWVIILLGAIVGLLLLFLILGGHK